MKYVTRSLIAISAICCSFTTSAVVLDGGPIFGPPIDVSGATHVGNVASGGMISTYNALGGSPVANIYFGLNSTGGPWGWSGNMDGIVTAAEAFTWFGDTANSIEYRGTTSITTAFGDLSRQTRLVLTALTGGTVVSDAQTQGLGNDVHSLIHFAVGSPSFSVKREIEVFNGSSWVDALPYFNSLSTLGQTARTNLGTGFYWENSATVPTPGVFSLVGIALLGLAASRRARR